MHWARPAITVSYTHLDVYKRQGVKLRGNFYKCGDLTRYEHYGMWNPVQSDTPDFHRPESFGELVLG